MADLREKLARLICEAIGDDWHREAEDGLIEAYGPVADQIIAALPELLVTPERVERAQPRRPCRRRRRRSGVRNRAARLTRCRGWSTSGPRNWLR